MSQKAREILIALWEQYNGVWEEIYKAIIEKKYIDEDLTPTVDTSKYITLLDEDYPIELKQSYKPPFVIERN